jgi:hypothetical protein
MRYLKCLALLGVLLAVATNAPAQVSVGIGIGPGYVVGPPPVCRYGYYDYYPYACAPYGFYGPEYFVGGVFIGAGPWYHGYYGPRFYRRPGLGYYGRGYYRPRYYGNRWYGHERAFGGYGRFGGRGFYRDGGHGLYGGRR